MQQNLRIPAGTAAADRAGTWMKLGWLAIAVGGIYILSAKLSLSLLTPDGVAVFWPAAGVAAGALIAAGPWARWAVVAGTMVATIVANLMGDRNLVSSMIFAVCNGARRC
jgi:integral membrane sensor domain MASE1